jgi:hypothetical protein
MGGYNTNMMANNEPETKLSKEFDRQVGNLIQKGYPKVAKVTAEEFTKHIKPLLDHVVEDEEALLGTLEGYRGTGRDPVGSLRWSSRRRQNDGHDG